jgi:hypothetical protein
VIGLGIELDNLRKKLVVGKFLVIDQVFDILACQGFGLGQDVLMEWHVLEKVMAHLI